MDGPLTFVEGEWLLAGSLSLVHGGTSMNRDALKAIIDEMIAAAEKATAGHPLLFMALHFLAFVVDDTALLDDILARLSVKGIK
jgi:hypothetical protein